MKEIYISKLEKIIFVILGFIISFCSLTLLYNTIYTIFFEREMYLRKKELYRYLKNNRLILLDSYFPDWVISYKINNTFKLNYWTYNESISIHDVNYNVYMTLIDRGYFDRKITKNIINILKSY